MFRSALSTMHEESVWAHLPNPITSDPRVGRLLTGVAKSRRAVHFADERQKAEPERSLDLTPALLAELAPLASRSDSPRLAMHWAAACLGTFGLLRLNELLGSAAHPERVLRTSQLKFCRTAACIPAMLPPQGLAATPDHLELNLLDTKADQLGANPPLRVATPLAVEAVWRWMLARRNLHRASPSPGNVPQYIFALPGEDPLTLRTLVRFLQDCLEKAGHGRPRITGKAFRRGGASAVVAANLPASVAAAAGRWASPHMPLVYASQEAKQRQALEISRAMGAPVA